MNIKGFFFPSCTARMVRAQLRSRGDAQRSAAGRDQTRNHQHETSLCFLDNVRLLLSAANRFPLQLQRLRTMKAPIPTEEGARRRGLVDRLAEALPKGHKFGIHHLSTPPTKCNALCSAPPDERPDKTFCESHFLLVSIDVRRTPTDDPCPVPILGVEIFIFTTAFSSIFFVSKADSTGFLVRLGLRKGTPSPIREVSSAFVTYLVEKRARPGLQCVVSLFARAQPQYLFVGSAENRDKHILDDRGLVKWWCKVLNPLVDRPPPAPRGVWASTKAYLLVPGLDPYETRAFIPRTSASSNNWVVGHPMEKISHYTHEYDWVPARCLIPRYPDDPKSRFRDDLDEEAAKSKILLTTGSWRSVTTVDQFWELMAFRQECSSGRLTGFIWLVFDPRPKPQHESQDIRPSTPPPSQAIPESLAAPGGPLTPPKQAIPQTDTPLTTPRKLGAANASVAMAGSRSSRRAKTKKRKVLKGKIRPRQPHVKTQQRNYLSDKPQSTAYYFWPPEGRGQRLVADGDYKRIVELLLRLDFSSLDRATGSTRRWLGEVGMGAAWEVVVEGTRETPVAQDTVTSGPTVNILTSAVKRKRTQSSSQGAPGPRQPTATELAVDPIKSDGLVERLVSENGGPPAPDPAPQINVLGAGFVRKRPKP